MRKIVIVAVLAMLQSGTAAFGGELDFPPSIVAIYEPITTQLKQESTAQLLKEIGANFLLRAFFKWGKTDSAPKRYEDLANSIKELKETIPHLVVIGGITCGHFDADDTWADGTPLSQKDFGAMVALNEKGEPWKRSEYGYVPDLGKPLFRRFLVEWCKKQIDAGVDGLHFDETYIAAFEDSTGLRYKFKPEYAQYFLDLVNELKTYAAAKGKKLLINTHGGDADAVTNWPPRGKFALPKAALDMEDFVCLNVSLDDFSPPFDMKDNWSAIKTNVARKLGKEVPIIAFMDWGDGTLNTSLGRFSNLTGEEQKLVLQRLDEATKKSGILLAYPVYGGTAYKGERYNSLQMGTYGTIKALARPSDSKR